MDHRKYMSLLGKKGGARRKTDPRRFAIARLGGLARQAKAREKCKVVREPLQNG